MPPRFASPDGAIPLHLVPASDMEGWIAAQPGETRDWLARVGPPAKLGAALLAPGPDGPVAVAGYGDAAARARTRFGAASAALALPEGRYALAAPLPADEAAEFAFGWLMEGRRFDRYAERRAPSARLAAPKGIDGARIEALVAGEWLARDLIDTPASDMGPGELEGAARGLAAEFGAALQVTRGEALEEGFPLIAAVGRASPRAPRLIDLTWGEGPALTLVGKGVCFDTGGLNLKPGASMGLMKKDMGGAANVLGAARAIMALGLEVSLRVLIPAVENAVSGAAFRPGDILRSRKGLTVEINNTDAEGRLVLADALALAAEGEPGLTACFATLTGAARVALGPDVPPFYTDDDALAARLMEGAARARDPVWRMPFHAPYEEMIEPGIADLDNAPTGGMAGSVTAALFLRRFAPARFVHLDVYGWCPKAAPGRQKGGLGQGWRALIDCLPDAL